MIRVYNADNHFFNILLFCLPLFTLLNCVVLSGSPPPPVIFIPVKLTDIYKEREAPELSSKLDQGDIVPIKQIWKYIYPDLVSSQVGLTHEVIFFCQWNPFMADFIVINST